jgi:hypothetical protein
MSNLSQQIEAAPDAPKKVNGRKVFAHPRICDPKSKRSITCKTCRKAFDSRKKAKSI